MASSTSSSSYPNSCRLGKKPQDRTSIIIRRQSQSHPCFFGRRNRFLEESFCKIMENDACLSCLLDFLILFTLVFFQFQALKASFSSPKSGKGGNLFGAAKGARICPRPSALCRRKKSCYPRKPQKSDAFFVVLCFMKIKNQISQNILYLRHSLLVTRPKRLTSDFNPQTLHMLRLVFERSEEQRCAFGVLSAVLSGVIY